MLGTKVGTTTWAKNQASPFKDDKLNYAPATADTGKGKEKPVGDILNEAANPGGKDPNVKHRKTHNSLDKDDFLKLMLTQMKNQDPMNPMQSHEMAAQLAQFTSLEQLFNVNKNLEGLTKGQDPIQRYEALNFLGKTIKADTKQVIRSQGDTGSDLRFHLNDDATKIKVVISDETGAEVKTIEFGNLKKGDNKIVWNGTDAQDREIKPGRYRFEVEAENKMGHKVGVLTETKGIITGINYTPEGPMLMVGDQRVRLADVQKIEDDGLKDKQLNQEQKAPTELAPASRNDLPLPEGAAPMQTQSQHRTQRAKPETRAADELVKKNFLPMEVAGANSVGASNGGNGMKAGGGPFGSR